MCFVENMANRDGFHVVPAVHGSLTDALDRIESLNDRLVHGAHARRGKTGEWTSHVRFDALAFDRNLYSQT